MLIIFPREYCLTRSATKLNWYYQKCKSLCVSTQVKNILGPSLVYVKCVLRNHAFRIAAAARTRDSQMRVTIDTRRFSANSTNARTMGRTHARTLRSVRELFFSFFPFSFLFFHSAKSLREYNTGGASLGDMQRRVHFYSLYNLAYFSVGGT